MSTTRRGSGQKGEGQALRKGVQKGKEGEGEVELPQPDTVRAG